LSSCQKSSRLRASSYINLCDNRWLYYLPLSVNPSSIAVAAPAPACQLCYVTSSRIPHPRVGHHLSRSHHQNHPCVPRWPFQVPQPSSSTLWLVVVSMRIITRQRIHRYASSRAASRFSTGPWIFPKPHPRCCSPLAAVAFAPYSPSATPHQSPRAAWPPLPLPDAQASPDDRNRTFRTPTTSHYLRRCTGGTPTPRRGEPPPLAGSTHVQTMRRSAALACAIRSDETATTP